MPEIHLTGSVGYSFWGEENFTPTSVREMLAGLSGDLTVHLNSGGGIATDGQAIYTLLRDYPGRVTVSVEGIAASAASLLAMAGDEIILRDGALLMIHDPASMWVNGRGTEDDHRKMADALAVISRAYAGIYAKRAGITVDAAREIMRAETWMDGDMAVDMGFADHTEVDAGAQASATAFDYSIYAKAPEKLRQAQPQLPRVAAKMAVLAKMAGATGAFHQKEPMMADKQTPAEVPANTPPVAAQVVASDAIAAERARAKKITDAVNMAGLSATMASDLIDKGVTAEEALTQILAARVEKPEHVPASAPSQTAKVTTDARDKFRTGAELGMMARAGMGGERNEFTGMTLSELARASLVMNGHSDRFSSRLDMVGAAITMIGGQHSTSDFANLLQNIAQKSLLKGWDSADETFEKWTGRGTLTDFKPTKRVGTGLFSDLSSMDEGSEYTYGTIGDRGETVTLATYGKMFALTRQAIINDDLSALTKIPVKMGRAARRTIGNLVYAVLTANPNMSDGVALFHASHNNLAGAGAAPTVTSFNAVLAAMGVQKESATSSGALNIRPAFCLAPLALKATIDQLLYSTVDPTATKGHAKNPVENMVTPIYDARLDAASATAHYFAADPNAYDTIEVSYLDGNDRPYFEQQDGWNRDGIEMKVRIDAAVAALDWRTLYKQPGA